MKDFNPKASPGILFEGGIKYDDGIEVPPPAYNAVPGQTVDDWYATRGPVPPHSKLMSERAGARLRSYPWHDPEHPLYYGETLAPGEVGEPVPGGTRFRKRGQVNILRLRDAIMSLAAEDLASDTLLSSLHHVFPKAYKEIQADKLRTVVAEFLPHYVANKTLTMGPDKHLVKLGLTSSSTLGTPFLGCPFLAKVDSFRASKQKLSLDFSHKWTRDSSSILGPSFSSFSARRPVAMGIQCDLRCVVTNGDPK